MSTTTAAPRVSFDEAQTIAERVLAEHPEIVLGQLCWYFITESDKPGVKSVPVGVRPEELAQWFDELGLDPQFLPPQLTRLNAFRKGSSEIDYSYQIGAGDKQRAILRVVEINYNDDIVLRHVIRDVIDKSSATLSSAHVATLRFSKPARSTKAQKQGLGSYQAVILDKLVEISPEDNKPTGNTYPLHDSDRVEIQKALAQFELRYAELAVHLQSQALRAMVRKILTSVNAVMCKPSGGVYFVHNDHKATVDALKALLARIGQGCSMVTTPMFDSYDMREQLTEALAAEIAVDCNKIMTKIAKVNEDTKGGKVSPTVYADINSTYQDAVDRVTDLTEKLGIAQARAGASLELVLTGLLDMSSRLGGPRR